MSEDIDPESLREFREWLNEPVKLDLPERHWLEEP